MAVNEDNNMQDDKERLAACVVAVSLVRVERASEQARTIRELESTASSRPSCVA